MLQLFLELLLVLSLILLVIPIVIVYFAGSIPSLRRFRLTQKIPGPKGVLFFGNGPDLFSTPTQDMLPWISSKLKKYDRMMKMWYFGFCSVYLYDPNDIQSLLNSIEHITKGLEYFILQPWLEEGLLTSNGEKWRSRRKLLTPAFHFKILEDNLIIFNKSAKILCEKFIAEQNEELILEKHIGHCTLDVIIKTAMGVDLEGETEGGKKYVSTVKQLSEHVAHRMMSPHLFNETIFSLSPTGRSFWKAVKYLQQFSSNVIHEKKKNILYDKDDSSVTVSSSGRERRAFLDLMLNYEKKNPGTFTDKDIREEVDTFMFEGHDTTSAALVFIFFNLALYQDIQDKVYNEIYEIFGENDIEATLSDIQRMVYLEKVIKESLRLFPSVPGLSRLLEKDLILGDGLVIPAMTNVIIPIFFLHKNEKFWEDPEKFDPERFSEDNVQGRHPYCYIPFSAGPRNCIGQKFALIELKVVVSSVIRKLKVLPVTKAEEVKVLLHLILRTQEPIKCKFVQRKSI